MAWRLFAVTMTDAHRPPPDIARTSRIVFRELAAWVEEVPYEGVVPDDADAQRHAEVLAALADHDSVLPAPPGIVFRTDDVLTRWLELHYVALTDALGFVEDRVAGRVHVRREAQAPDADAGLDVAAAAADIMRALRRRAVGTLPLGTEKVTGIVLSSAFLVERELWKEFAQAVRAQQQENPGLTVELTGPWPPYDFVRMQFGS